MLFRQLFDKESSTYTYLIADSRSKSGVLIDPVQEQFHRDCQLIDELDIQLKYVLETHIHADHLSAASYLKQKLGGRIGVSAGVLEVQRHFKTFYGLGNEFSSDGSQFDHLFAV